MNIERLTTIAEWLEAGAPERDGVAEFNMEVWIEPNVCGTTCCIGGTAAAWWCDGTLSDDRVAKALGFENDRDSRYGELCYPRMEPWDGITKTHAARCIRKLIATGAVDWEGTREVAP